MLGNRLALTLFAIKIAKFKKHSRQRKFEILNNQFLNSIWHSLDHALMSKQRPLTKTLTTDIKHV